MINKGTPLKLSIQKDLHPAYSIAMDEMAYRSVRHGGAVLRIYTWRPEGLSLGSREGIDYDVEKMDRDGYVLVKRHTPGWGVWTGSEEINYSFFGHRSIFKSTDGKFAQRAFCFFNGLIYDALRELGAKVVQNYGGESKEYKSADCFGMIDHCEITDEAGHKVHGGAAHTGNVYVQQGQVPLTMNYRKLTNYMLTPKVPIIEPTCLEDIIGRTVPLEMAQVAVVEEYRKYFRIESWAVTEGEAQIARAIMNDFEVAYVG